MTRGANPLSYEQKQIIKANCTRMFPSTICRMEGMEGTTTRQVADYIRMMPEKVDAELVVWILETWIEKHGLNAGSGGVIRFIGDLKKKG